MFHTGSIVVAEYIQEQSAVCLSAKLACAITGIVIHSSVAAQLLCYDSRSVDLNCIRSFDGLVNSAVPEFNCSFVGHRAFVSTCMTF